MPASGAQRARFLADAMLGSLARKLRALGFDTAYFKSGDDSELLDMATTEGRVILTSDRSLATTARRKGLRVIFMSGRSDGIRIREMTRTARAMGVSLTPGDPLCSICDGALRTITRHEVAGRVPQSVEKRHRRFYECVRCGKLYWRGGHWKKLRSLSRLLRDD